MQSNTQKYPVRAVFVSSYIPKRCGIATYTRDLRNAFNRRNGGQAAGVIAIKDNPDEVSPPEVKMAIERDDPESYLAAARYLNNQKPDLVCLQHEYGLFGGGHQGEYVLNLLENLEAPIVTTLHTILDNPGPEHKSVLLRVAELSDVLISMTEEGKKRLVRDYHLSPRKIVTIYHGSQATPKAVGLHKAEFGWENRQVILISGFVSPDKGIDFAIRAMPEILAKYPNALLAVIGQTHPDIYKKDGDAYWLGLRNLADSLGVGQSVFMLNQYLNLDELLRYYEASDIYLTPHLQAQQASSGTLAYALGMGKACISTGYLFAKEMLASNRGLLVGFRDSHAIAQAAQRILGNPLLRCQLEENAYQLGKQMTWDKVAEKYWNIFRLITDLQTGLEKELVRREAKPLSAF